MSCSATSVRSGNVNAGARLDRLPASAFHRRILLLIGTGMFLDACDIYLAPGVLGALVKSGWSDVAHNALFLSATFAGMLVGTLLSGFVGDRLGRRFSYQVNLLIFGIGSLLATVAPDMQSLIVLRFFMGIGMGAEIVVGYASLTEFMPRAVRGRYAAILAAVTNLSVVAVGFVGLWIIPTVGWRYMFGIIGVAALGIWVLRKNMPESPRWLESRGRLAEAEAVMQSIEREVAAGGSLPPVQVVPVPQPTPFSELFRPVLLRRLLVGAVVVSVSSFSLYGFLSWVPTFLVKDGFSLARSLWFTALMGLGAPIGALVAAAVADQMRRPRLIAIFCVAEAVLGGVYPFVGSGTELVLVGFCLTICSYALVSLGTGLYVPEMFPTTLRLRGTAIVGSAGRLTSSVVPFVIVSVFGAFGLVGVSGVLVCMLLLQAIIVLIFGPDTSDRSLEEIGAPPVDTPVGAMQIGGVPSPALNARARISLLQED